MRIVYKKEVHKAKCASKTQPMLHHQRTGGGYSSRRSMVAGQVRVYARLGEKADEHKVVHMRVYVRMCEGNELKVSRRAVISRTRRLGCVVG